jgi:hypothetical protein
MIGGYRSASKARPIAPPAVNSDWLAAGLGDGSPVPFPSGPSGVDRVAKESPMMPAT